MQQPPVHINNPSTYHTCRKHEKHEHTPPKTIIHLAPTPTQPGNYRNHDAENHHEYNAHDSSYPQATHEPRFHPSIKHHHHMHQHHNAKCCKNQQHCFNYVNYINRYLVHRTPPQSE